MIRQRLALFGLSAVAAMFLALPVVGQADSLREKPTSKVANVFNVEMSVVRDGVTLASPKMVLLFGKPAQFTLVEPGQSEGSIRVQITTTPGNRTSAGQETVRIDAMVLEQIGKAWVVIGEPSILAADGREAMMSVDGGVGQVGINVKATSSYNEKAFTVTPRQCSAVDAPIVAKSGVCVECDTLPCDSCPNCCQADCNDGSGRVLKCCGAISCCDGVCDACCEPPQV